MPLHVPVNKSAKDLALSSAGSSALGGLGAVGSIVGSLYSASQARKEAQRNRDFQERMSNSTHQREVADLRKAGLNPILSAKLGGASSPAGGIAQQPDLGSSTAKDIVSGAQIALLQAQARKTTADAVNSELQEAQNKALSEVFSNPAGTAFKVLQLGAGAAGVAGLAGKATKYVKSTYKKFKKRSK